MSCSQRSENDEIHVEKEKEERKEETRHIAATEKRITCYSHRGRTWNKKWRKVDRED